MDERTHAAPSTPLVEVLVETTDGELRERLLVECVHAMGLAAGVVLCHPSRNGWKPALGRGDAPEHVVSAALGALTRGAAWKWEGPGWCTLLAGIGAEARALVFAAPGAEAGEGIDQVQALLALLTMLAEPGTPAAPLPAAADEEERLRRHDLRNALHAVTSTHELLKRFGADLSETERTQFERSLEDECARVSRLAVRRASLHARELGHALEAVLLAERAPCAMARIDLVPDLPATQPAATSALSPDHAARALQNLLVNAREALAGRDGGRIEVSLRCEGELWCLTVEDDGPGIAPELAGRLFKQGASSKGTGRGSGLASIASTLRALGGSIVAGRSRLGGARFALRWPLVVAQG